MLFRSAPQEKKLKPEDFEKKPEEKAEEATETETVPETQDLEDLVNAIGSDEETPATDDEKQD